jgi:hypothetical protein
LFLLLFLFYDDYYIMTHLFDIAVVPL